MKPILAFFCFLFCGLNALSQDISELEKRNGFKDLKLGMLIDSVRGEKKLKKEFKERDEFPARLYAIDHADYQKIGEVRVNKVEVKTYKDVIYQISIVADKDRRLMKALESIYGQAEYDLKAETYFWRSDSMILKFKSYSKNQLEMEYTSYLVTAMMREDKNKKVQDIADDF